MELRRPRGVFTYVTYPLKDASGNLVTGVTTLRPQYATFTDASPVSTISNIAGYCAELGATGIYYSSLSAAEMANDYVYFIASATSGSSKRIDLLINCTKVASVQAVSDTVTATLSSGTGTGQANLSNGRIGINWADILNATTTQALTLTTIASVNNVATTNFVASVSAAVLSNVGTVTGVTNSVNVGSIGTVSGVTNTVQSNVIQWLTVPPNVLTGGRVDSYAAVLNWASVTAPGTAVDLTNTTIATASNVATVQFVASVSASVLSNVGTVTGVVNSVSANVGTISGVTNRVDATLTQGVQSMIADRVLSRSLARGSDGGRTVQDAFRILRNKRGLTFGVMNTATLTAYAEDDSTPAWTAIVATASAVGLTDVDAS